MASLKCSNCGNRINYHDESDGTQYIVFSEHSWLRLIESDIYVSRYLLEDNVDLYFAWVCKECGAIHIFNQNSAIVSSTYRQVKSTEFDNKTSEKFIAISDINWDIITETQIYGKDISKLHPDCKILSIRKSNEHFLIETCYNKNEALYELINK